MVKVPKLSEEEIVKKLKEIRDKGEKIETGISLYYKGKTEKFDSYKIPLNYLKYNIKNGRIASRVKSYENREGKINIETENGNKLIEKFLWNAHKEDNEKTEKDILEKGQLVKGIVTKEGIIIDGNRRALILNKINERYFIAIILSDDIKESEIEEIELEVQFGEESKIVYRSIEKYLKARDFSLGGRTPFEIAKIFKTTHKEINKYLNVLNLMEEYLDYLGDKDYTLLYERETHFTDLNNALKFSGIHKVKWDSNDQDEKDLKKIAFDYIRKLHEGKEYRYLFGKKKISIFGNKKNIWNNFKKRHFEILGIIEEDSIKETRNKNPNKEEESLIEREKIWKKQVERGLNQNIKNAVYDLEDKKEIDKPVKKFNNFSKFLENMNLDNLEKKELKALKKNMIKINDCFKEAIPNIEDIERSNRTPAEKKQDSLNEQGGKAEEFVLNYERKRNPGCDIKQKSKEDSSAGYDILSNQKTGEKRYIEVKSFSGKIFNWSENEVKKSKEKQDNYYIYLVDNNKIEEKYYEPTKIQNPYKEIYDNELAWKKEVGSWKFTKKSANFMV